MRAPKMTRKRALELAQECVLGEMKMLHGYHYLKPDPVVNKNQDRYAELAAALAVIEHMARQKEMTL